jgi:hypothetical protein
MRQQGLASSPALVYSPRLRPSARAFEPRGEVPEWSIGTVSKTVVGASSPWVRIPPSPPQAKAAGGVPPPDSPQARPAGRRDLSAPNPSDGVALPRRPCFLPPAAGALAPDPSRRRPVPVGRSRRLHFRRFSCFASARQLAGTTAWPCHDALASFALHVAERAVYEIFTNCRSLRFSMCCIARSRRSTRRCHAAINVKERTVLVR